MKFKDRRCAGLQLARALSWLRGEDVVILAIPRGGVVIGDAIAEAIGAKLDVIVPRKLGAPYNPELAIGAVMHDGSYYMNEYVINALGIGQDYIRTEIHRQVTEIKRRLALYRGSAVYQLERKTVVLVDDGIATGATAMVAVLWIKNQKPAMVVLAVPVAPSEVIRKLNEIVDRSLVLHSPEEFAAVGEFYDDFRQVEDEEVVAMIAKYKS
jgi:predicted phosphoribosyltransferase